MDSATRIHILDEAFSISFPAASALGKGMNQVVLLNFHLITGYIKLFSTCRATVFREGKPLNTKQALLQHSVVERLAFHSDHIGDVRKETCCVGNRRYSM